MSPRSRTHLVDEELQLDDCGAALVLTVTLHAGAAKAVVGVKESGTGVVEAASRFSADAMADADSASVSADAGDTSAQRHNGRR